MSLRMFHATRSSSRVWWWIQVAALFLVGVLLTAIPWEASAVQNVVVLPKWMIHLLPQVGDAFVVAVVLVLVVDRAAKRDLLKEFAKDVSVHIIGRLLPSELREYIEDFLESDFVRSEWRITYTITPWDEVNHPDFERIVTLSEYDMQNRTNTPKNYVFHYEVEESSDPTVGHTTITRCSARCLPDSERESFDRTGAALKLTRRNNAWSFEETVSVPPTPGGDYHFTAESIECCRNGATIPFFARYPTLSTSLTVNYPKDRLDIVVDLSFGDVEEDAVRIDLETGREWIFRKPMLPGQGFTVRILKAAAAKAAAAVTGKSLSVTPPNQEPTAAESVRPTGPPVQATSSSAFSEGGA